jgi:hypothetical protein
MLAAEDPINSVSIIATKKKTMQDRLSVAITTMRASCGILQRRGGEGG